MKYFSHKVERRGVKFDSMAEADRYEELLIMQKKGVISGLELQKGFEIIPSLLRKEVVQLKTKVKTVYRTDEKAAWYHCDFYYFDAEIGKWIIEEFKSKMTAKLTDYILRRKLIKQLVNKWNTDAGKELYEFREIIWNGKKKSKSNKKK